MLYQNSHIAKNPKLANGKKMSSICEMQRLIGESGSFEPEANMLLRSVGLPEIAGYLALSYTLNLDANHFPDHDLGQLLLAALHGEFLNRDVKDIDVKNLREELVLNRHNHLTDEEFQKLSDFVEVKVSPLIIERNYQSLAVAMIDCVIDPYDAFDERNKLLLKRYIRQTARIGEVQYHYQKVLHAILRISMRGERDTQVLNSSLERTIEELRSNWRIEHPTNFEQLLSAFRERNFEPIEAEELAQLLFSDSTEPERAVHNTISKLNSKLKNHNLKIERFSSYELCSLGEGES
jgi:hypothetical protein